MKTESRGITRINLRNIGKFEFFEMELKNGEIVELQGTNDEGKSTIPLAIEAAIFGKLEGKTGPSNFSKDGEGTITLEANGQRIIRDVKRLPDGKLITKNCEAINIATNSHDYEKKAVQEFLDKNFPKGTFLNPFELQSMKKKEQISAIVKALPLDIKYTIDRLTAICKGKYDATGIENAEGLFNFITRITDDFVEERKQLGRKKDSTEAAYKGALKALPEDYDPNTPAPIPPAAMQDIYDAKAVIVSDNAKRDEYQRRIASNDKEITRLEEIVATLRNNNVNLVEQFALLGQAKDTTDLDLKITNHRQSMETYQKALEVHGDRKRRHTEQDTFYKEWQAILATHADLDGRVKALAKLPAELFSRAELPIQGMYIEGDTIMLPDENGELRPAEEFGDAALLDLYIALAMTLAPIPVILADGLERCGPKRSQEIYDRIRAKGFQLIGTRVTEGPLKVVHIPDSVEEMDNFKTQSVPGLAPFFDGTPFTPVTEAEEREMELTHLVELAQLEDEPEFDFDIPEDLDQ